MRTASDYRQYAKECRQLAGQEKAGEARGYLLEMAELWTRLASDSAAAEAVRAEVGSDDRPGANDSQAPGGGDKAWGEPSP